MFSKLFGRRRREEEQVQMPEQGNSDWSFLGADMHSHFIPGIDDGARTMEESIAMIKAMKALGFDTLITTPHIMVDFYPNTTQVIQDGLQHVQQALRENNIDVTLRAAAEYYIDEHFIKLLNSEPLLTIRDKEVLVEFSMMYEPPMLMDVIFNMRSAGYIPVIAHPERYLFFHNDMGKYRMLKERGCLFQMNILSVTGYYGKGVKAAAEELIKKVMYDYCGSDMHHIRHASALKSLAHSKDRYIFSGYPFQNKRLSAHTV